MSLKTAGIREFARMIGRSHSWVVSQCQRNIIPKTTDGKIPVDDALKIVAQLDEEKSREKVEYNQQVMQPCLYSIESNSCYQSVIQIISFVRDK